MNYDSDSLFNCLIGMDSMAQGPIASLRRHNFGHNVTALGRMFHIKQDGRGKALGLGNISNRIHQGRRWILVSGKNPQAAVVDALARGAALGSAVWAACRIAFHDIGGLPT